MPEGIQRETLIAISKSGEYYGDSIKFFYSSGVVFCISNKLFLVNFIFS